MKRIILLSNDFLYRLITKRVLILLIFFFIAISFLCLSAAGYFDFTPAKRDIYLDNILHNYYHYFFLITKTVFIIISTVICILGFSKSFNNSSEYMYLTGGVNRTQLFASKLLGIILFNSILFLILCFSSMGVTVFLNLGFINSDVFLIFLKLCINSIFINLLSILLIIIFKNIIFGFSSCFFYIIYFLFSDTISQTKNINNMLYAHKILNRILPLFSFSSPDVTLDNFERYLYLKPMYGELYLLGVMLLICVMSAYVYQKSDL